MSINHEVKGTLAKLLATENLIIEHKKVPTASFDVLRRVLTLPIWDKASSVVYDLLVGHEVGHALYTPNKDWTQELKVPKDYVNVVEDARIEKLMKRKFPGLARTFYNGYKELSQEDFFSIANEKIDRLSLIDRINLHYKIGAYSQMPFNEEEYVFVEMIDTAESFDDVLNICELIYNYTKNQNLQNINIVVSSDIVQQSEGGIENNTTEVESSNFKVLNEGESDNQSSEKAQNNSDQNSTTNNKQSSDNIFGSGPEDEIDQNVSKTQKSFDEQTANLNNNNNYSSETYYVERPCLDMKHVVVDYKVLLKYINKQYIAQDPSAFDWVDKKLKEYQNESQKEVNYLVKEFEMKKSADAYQRMSMARTGTLNTSKLHMYKYSEDLFRKVSVVPDSKNHGLIFVLDWSGSMSDYLVDTVKQLLNLIWFCRKVQIPFEVYAFTYEWSNQMVNKNYVHPTVISEEKDGNMHIHRKFNLLNFLSSRSNAKELNQSILNLWRLACREDRDSYFGCLQYYNPCGLSLSGTPLNESIIALHQIIPNFKQSNNLQKINVVILTDGESAHLQYYLNLQTRYNSATKKIGLNYISGVNALRDRKIGHVYRNFDLSSFDSNTTSILLENLKDNFPEVNLIGFRILNGSGFYHLCKAFTSGNSKTHDEVMKVWKKQKSYEINGMGYDALYLISSNNLSVDTTMHVNDDATTTEIGRAFRTMLKKKTTNKKLLSSFASLVS